MHDVEVVDLRYHPDSATVSFTAKVTSIEGTTTVSSFARTAPSVNGVGEIHRLIEHRIAEVLERPAPSGRLYRPAS
ncbi:hypothetical protein [Pelagibacterium xiamenense]|uniref:hypothetical protein n=1 Tax=Pelagibacterium xiamenense TaxID=2901140 RepID=UPI001E611FA1|nr:hypothetical protein [Pelagibacterium xiamenense]MCD7059725.1 hypothetical protein [Pelagibacterium xiamenense]